MQQTLLMTDQAQSVFARANRSFVSRAAYCPFGSAGPADPSEQVGFTGQWRHRPGGLYLPGNGYRAYPPRLGRFTRPDPHSPFGTGGRNGYAYCAGDPLNRRDPSGRAFTPLVIAGLIGGLVNTAVQVASLGGRSAKQTPPAMARGFRLAVLAGVAGVASSLVAGTQPDNQPVQQALAWTGIALGVTSGLLRLSVQAPDLYHAGPRKVAGRLFGLSRTRASAETVRTTGAWYARTPFEHLVDARR